MRKLFFPALFALVLLSPQAQAQRRTPAGKGVKATATPTEIPNKIDVPGMHPGAANPFLEEGFLDATDSKKKALKSFATEKGLALIFISNTCEAVQQQKKAIQNFVQQAQTAGVGVVFVNSNQREMNDLESPPAMQEYAIREGIKQSYILDENMILAYEMGVQRFPEVFIFNGENQLAYRGAIEGNTVRETLCLSCMALENLSDIGSMNYTVTAGTGCDFAPRD